MPSLRIGIVGCGGIAEAHGEAVKKLAGVVEFAACCDIDLERARSWSEQYHAGTAYADMGEMISSVELDGVLLATWPNLHRDQVEQCLDLGVRNILCEKSLAVTGAEATEIYDLVRKAGAYVMEGFMYRHHPAIREMERIIRDGSIGNVDYVRGAFSNDEPEIFAADDATRNWRYRRECAGGVAFDYACYPINACGHFAGGIPVRASAHGSMSQKYDIMDRLFGVIEYSNGCTGIIESSKKSAFSQELDVSGSQALLRLPIAWTIDGDTALAVRSSPDWGRVEAREYPITSADPYRIQLENFAAVVRDGASPLVPLVQSVVNVHVIEALMKSANEHFTRDIELRPDIEEAYSNYLADR